MLKFLKMTVAEDVITTEEVVADLVEEEAILEVQLQEEKEALLQEEKVQADLEATEILRLEKVDLAEEEKVVFHLTDLELKVHLTEHLDVLKALVTHQDQEDQEETNIYC